VLLVQFRFDPLVFWAPPGGGLEGDEDEATALHRELAEEVGLVDATLGPVVYTHERAYVRRRGGQRDVVVRVDVPETFTPRPHLTVEELRAEHVMDLRWFSLPELRRLPTLPYDLASIVERLDTLDGPLHLDDLRVPPVLVVVSGREGASLARAVGARRGLSVVHDVPAAETVLADGRSVVLGTTDAGDLRALQVRRRVQIVQLATAPHPIDVDGPLLLAPDLDASLAFVDQVLPPTQGGRTS
jgi:8-oxo-dGTP pyrophosphatase MutT (NUDIX family)